jgi:hypothetical protein
MTNLYSTRGCAILTTYTAKQRNSKMEKLAALEASIANQKAFIAEKYAEANAQGFAIPANIVAMKSVLQQLVNEYNDLSTTIGEGL